ncbi:Ros/MucR family transcriptional regulator [Alsobacter sp. R-9]
MPETDTHTDLVTLASDLVAAYVSNNAVALAELPALIAEVHKALVASSTGALEKPVETQAPAVSIKKSVQPDFIVCLEDGQKFKSLKRHLRTKYDMSPEAYRAKWGLPAEYPMVAPNYAATRSELAKSMGLGQQRRKGLNAPTPVKKSRNGKAA